jgi:ABC-type transport system involved in multi-copper enzyme maturation permease subunit
MRRHGYCSQVGCNRNRHRHPQENIVMLKFLASTVGIIFLIGLVVVILLLMLIF